MNGKMFRLLTFPPAPLFASQRFLNELNGDILSTIANAFYNKYDVYKLEDVSWLYWHAAAAEVHTAPAQYGATFESIERAFIAAKGSRLQKSLLKKSTWKSLKKDIETAVMSKSMDDKARKILGNKIESLNQKPATVVTEEFLARLDIDLSNAESLAWKNRHLAAHGSLVGEQDYVRVIKETKLLKLLCNRVLLSITGGSDCYIDYYSQDFPVKGLQTPAA